MLRSTTVGDYFIHYPPSTGAEPALAPLTQVGWYDVSVAGFSEFYITTLGSPLPVELVSFDATRVDADHVQVTWSTASEEDNLGFEVWRRLENEDTPFRVGWVNGALNSQQLMHYGMIDPNPSLYTSYYFLRQVDIDGAHADGPMAAVTGSHKGSTAGLYPNPAQDIVHLHGVSSPMLFELYTLDGRMVTQGILSSDQLSVSELPTGSYLLRLGTHGERIEHLDVLH